MAWKDVNVSEQRVRFVLRASSGQEEMAGLCREFGISRPTGYAWLKRYQEVKTVAELKEKSRRPHRSPRRTAPEIEQRIVAERQKRPDWGARKFQVLLHRDGLKVPVCTIHRVLQRSDLIKPHRQHPPALRRFERERPNQLWQMDFKGLPDNLSQGWAPLSVLDDCSRYCLGLDALPGQRRTPVQQSVEKIFEQCGVPDAMLMDHGTPWWNNQHPNGWTQLAIWLMNQNIQLHFAAVRHPQTQGKVERFHRSLEDALHERGFPAQRQDWPEWLQRFRQEYNHIRPHVALQMATPASRWTPSTRAYQAKVPDWEYPSGGHVLRVRSSGQILFAHTDYLISGALNGEWVQLQPLTPSRMLVFYHRTCVRELNLEKRQSYPVYYSREQNVFDSDL